MRVPSTTELMRLTRIELCDLAALDREEPLGFPRGLRRARKSAYQPLQHSPRAAAEG